MYGVSSAPLEGNAPNNNNNNNEALEDSNVETKFGGGGYHTRYHGDRPYYNRPQSDFRPTRQTIPQPQRTLPVGVDLPAFDSSLSNTLLNLQQLQGSQGSQGGIPQTGFQGSQQPGFPGQGFQSGGGGQQQTGGRPQTGFQGGQQTGFQSGGQQQTGFQSGGQQRLTQQTGPTTENPTEAACIRRCESTSQYNPVCGTDNITYSNPNRLTCAQECSRSKLIV